MMFAHVLIKRVRKLFRCERGGALAELAILAPFLALMLAAVCEIGRYFQNYTALSKGTRSAARYLSNHTLSNQEIGRATSLVVCGKLTCAGGDELIKGIGGGATFSASNVCIEKPTSTTITVRITRLNDCNPVAGAPAGNPYNYQSIFSLGVLLHNPSLNFNVPLAPRTTMYRLPI